MTTEISVARALVELKIIDYKLKKLTEEPTFFCVDVRSKNRNVSSEGIKRDATADFQLFNDLLKRQETIKTAIKESNIKTIVRVGDWSGNINKAIQRKKANLYKLSLINVMKSQLKAALTVFDTEKRATSEALQVFLASENKLGLKTPEEMVALTNKFNDANKIMLVDPLGCKTLAAKLLEEVEVFNNNIEWVLAESDVTTSIVI